MNFIPFILSMPYLEVWATLIVIPLPSFLHKLKLNYNKNFRVFISTMESSIDYIIIIRIFSTFNRFCLNKHKT